MQPLISVIVPIYKIDQYLGFCIESILYQTYKNLEIILVDDGSPDRCPEICDLYAKKDKRIKVIHQFNGGLVSARKKGLIASSGEYIGYVDGDDWIEKNYYQDLYDSLASNNSDVVIAGFCRDLFEKSKCIRNNMSVGVYEGELLEKFLKNMISYGDFFIYGVTTYVWNKLFKKNILSKYQMSVPDIVEVGEDAAVVYPFLAECKKINIISNFGYHYRQREDSMLKKFGNSQIEYKQLKILYEYLHKIMKRWPLKYNFKEQVNDLVLSTYLVRSGAQLLFRNDIVPYSLFHVIFGKKTVLFGAGTFGQHMYRCLNSNKYTRIIAWVDDDYLEYRRCCMDVDSIESILNLNYDYIIIASLDCVYSMKVRERLKCLGVMEEKIILVKIDKDKKIEMLTKYLEM